MLSRGRRDAVKIDQPSGVSVSPARTPARADSASSSRCRSHAQLEVRRENPPAAGADQRPSRAQWTKTLLLRIEFPLPTNKTQLSKKRNHGEGSGGCSDPGHDACAVGTDLHPNSGVVRSRR